MGGWISGLTIAMGLMATPEAAVSQPLAGESIGVVSVSRVRSSSRSLLALIARTTEQSQTFRRLVETIDASDGLVYVEPGVCKHGVRACLVNVKSAGGQRVLFVKVYIRRTDRALMAAIGHELQHAVEVLNDPTVTDQPTMYFFYKRNRDRVGTSTAFETQAAIKAGEDVGEEVRQFLRAEEGSGRR